MNTKLRQATQLRVKGCRDCPLSGRSYLAEPACNGSIWSLPQGKQYQWRFEGERFPSPPPSWCPLRARSLVLTVVDQAVASVAFVVTEEQEENLRELLEKCGALLAYVDKQAKHAGLAWEHSEFDHISGFDEHLIEELQTVFDRFQEPSS